MDDTRQMLIADKDRAGRPSRHVGSHQYRQMPVIPTEAGMAKRYARYSPRAAAMIRNPRTASTGSTGTGPCPSTASRIAA